MDRRRTIVAAVSVALVGTSGAFAASRGVFGSPSVASAASLPQVAASLAPQTRRAVRTSRTTAVSARDEALPASPPAGAHEVLIRDVTPAPAALPTVPSSVDPSPENAPTSEPETDPTTMEPAAPTTTAPTTTAPATTTTRPRHHSHDSSDDGGQSDD